MKKKHDPEHERDQPLAPPGECRLCDLERIEVAIWDHQTEWITKRYGKDRARTANVGWATENLSDGFAVSTKVYGRGVLTTTSTALGVFQDEWDDRS